MKKNLILIFLFIGIAAHSQDDLQTVEIPRKISIPLLNPEIRRVIFQGLKDLDIKQPQLEIREREDLTEPFSVSVLEFIFKDKLPNHRILKIQVSLEKNHGFFKVIDMSKETTNGILPTRSIPDSISLFVNPEVIAILLNPLFEDAFQKALNRYRYLYWNTRWGWDREFTFSKLKRSAPDTKGFISVYEMEIVAELEGKSESLVPEVIRIRVNFNRAFQDIFDIQAAVYDLRTSTPINSALEKLQDATLIPSESSLNQIAREIADSFIERNSLLTNEMVIARELRCKLAHKGITHQEIDIDPTSPAVRELFKELTNFPRIEIIVRQILREGFRKK